MSSFTLLYKSVPSSKKQNVSISIFQKVRSSLPYGFPLIYCTGCDPERHNNLCFAQASNLISFNSWYSPYRTPLAYILLNFILLGSILFWSVVYEGLFHEMGNRSFLNWWLICVQITNLFAENVGHQFTFVLWLVLNFLLAFQSIHHFTTNPTHMVSRRRGFFFR